MVNRTLIHFKGELIEWQWSSDHEFLKEPFWTSCFLIDGLLVDCAAPASAEDFRNFIKKYEIDKCIITHAHEDHCGCGYILRNEFNIPIYASEKAIPLLKSPKDYPDYRRVTWGWPYKPFEAIPIGDKIITESGNYIFEMLPMPGHAEELIALIEREHEWAFTTDAIMPTYKMLFSKNTDISEDISKIYNSIRNLYNYTKDMKNLKIITTGRGIFDGRKLLKEKIQEIELLHKNAHYFYLEAKERFNKEKSRIRYVVRKMFKKESFIGTFTRGDLSISNLILSLLEWPLEE
ncbi:MAG: MBL fold metallo-hydrolase [Promethearchaeia archaeon]